MKLYRVAIEYAVVVVARDPGHAEHVAQLELRRLTDWETPSDYRADDAPIETREQLDAGWAPENVPYGIPEHDARQTIAQWLDSPDPLTESEMEAQGQTNMLAP